MKSDNSSKATDIEWLLHRYPSLRVAFIQKVKQRTGATDFYSVLIRSAKRRREEHVQQQHQALAQSFTTGTPATTTATATATATAIAGASIVGVEEAKQTGSVGVNVSDAASGVTVDGGMNLFAVGGDDVNEEDVEVVYKVKLPGDPVIGEGKPENQNHAIIFSRGEYVQTIDMNQVIVCVPMLVLLFLLFVCLFVVIVITIDVRF